MATAPPNPYKDPEAYLAWLADEMSRCLLEGDTVGLSKLSDELLAIKEQLAKQ
jgi:hypothetical protein